MATLTVPVPRARGDNVITIEMNGTPRGERVWYSPLGLQIEPNQILRFVNLDPGNVHTVTAFHPSQQGLPRRIPEGVVPFDSGFLMPNETFDLKLTKPGVYDYFCLPHLRGGMVGRILVGEPDEWMEQAEDYVSEGLPNKAIETLPSVYSIREMGPIVME